MVCIEETFDDFVVVFNDCEDDWGDAVWHGLGCSWYSAMFVKPTETKWNGELFFTMPTFSIGFLIGL